MSTDARAGADRLPPPPRPVSASQLTRGARLAFLLFAALALFISTISLIGDAVRLSHEAQRLRTTGRIVAKEKDTSPSPARFELRYRFQHNGEDYDGGAEVSEATFTRVKEGDACSVTYLPENPRVSRLEDPEPLDPSRPAVLSTVLLRSLVILMMVGAPWTIFEIVAWRQRDLARTGVLVAAIIYERGTTRRGNTNEFWVRYGYQPPACRRRENGRCALQQVAWDLYPVLARAPALVDPRRPRRHKLLAAFTLVRFPEPAPQLLLELWAPLPPDPADFHAPLPPTVRPAVGTVWGAPVTTVAAPVAAGNVRRSPAAEPFLRAVREAPADNGPRLVYADWLEEQGDPRGEFIRAQCELAELDDRDPRCAALRAREEELWRTHGAEWSDGLPVINGLSWLPFVRGFPSVVTVSSLATFVSHAEELFAAAPVCGLRLRTEHSPDGSFPGRFPAPLDLSALAALPQTARLSLLDLSGARLDLPGVEALAGAANFTGLTELILDDTLPGNVSLVPLARSPTLTNLRVLSLCDNGLHNQAARVLASATHLTRLAVLNLRGNRIGIGGARALAAPRWLAQLRVLDLGGNSLTTEEMRELQMRWGRALRL